MASRRKNNKSLQNTLKETSPHLIFRGAKESTLLAFIGISLFFVLSLFSYSPSDPAWSHSVSSSFETKVLNMGGYVGAHFADISFYLFGLIAYLIPVLIVFLGWFIYRHMNNKTAQDKWFYVIRSAGFFMTILSACAISTMHFSHTSISLPADIGSGGIIGDIIANLFTSGFSFIGTTLLLLTLFLVGITWLTNLSWLWLMDETGKWMLFLSAAVLSLTILLYNKIYHYLNNNYQRRKEARSELAVIDSHVVVDEIDVESKQTNDNNHTNWFAKMINKLSFFKSKHDITEMQDSEIYDENGNNLSEDSSQEHSIQEKSAIEISTFNSNSEVEEAEINEIDDSNMSDESVMSKIIPDFLRKNHVLDEEIEPEDDIKIDPVFNSSHDTSEIPSFSTSSDVNASIAKEKHQVVKQPINKAPSKTVQAPIEEKFAQVSESEQINNNTQSKQTAKGASATDFSNTFADNMFSAKRDKVEEPIENHPIDVTIAKHQDGKTHRVIKESQSNLFEHDIIDQLPALSLLDKPMPSENMTTKEHLEMLSRLIEQKLADYNMVVEVVAVQQGPVITRFELELAPGIKVSQLTNLSKDLARALLVVSIRVVEVIAGKSTVGIEIPNEYREIVSFFDVLNSKQYTESKQILPLGLGHDISGNPVVADLAKMPHLLVAGTTGSGKSVGVNSMILSMLFHANADELRLIMVDPKMLELSVYEGIPHLLCPVVTDMMEAANALRWCVAEMERRYKLLSALGVRNISGYNKKVKDGIEAGEPLMDPLFEPNPMMASLRPDPLETLPYIVIVIDEFADMMMVVGKKVEELIARLAQKARAAGMHLIIATQRPSVNVITGLIKANVPTRIAFQVSSKIDSRTILDQMGAQDLLGNGDMLFLPPGTGMPQRVHGAFVSDDEVHAVVNDLKSKGSAEYIDEILSGEGVEGVAGIPGEDSGNEMDPLYDQACAIVIETRKASISGVQRRLKVGYNRAARMVEDMEAAGLVSKVQSNGQREVIAPQN